MDTQKVWQIKKKNGVAFMIIFSVVVAACLVFAILFGILSNSQCNPKIIHASKATFSSEATTTMNINGIQLVVPQNTTPIRGYLMDYQNNSFLLCSTKSGKCIFTQVSDKKSASLFQIIPSKDPIRPYWIALVEDYGTLSLLVFQPKSEVGEMYQPGLGGNIFGDTNVEQMVLTPDSKTVLTIRVSTIDATESKDLSSVLYLNSLIDPGTINFLQGQTNYAFYSAGIHLRGETADNIFLETGFLENVDVFPPIPTFTFVNFVPAAL